MSNSRIAISVVIPTYNRPGQLHDCLRSLAESAFPPDRFELIIVDDGGQAELENTVVGFNDRLRLRLVRKEHGGPASARNAGAVAAKGEFIAFTDDDCRPAQQWLARLEARLRRHPDCMIGGRTVNALTRNAYAVTSQLILDLVYSFFNADGDNARFFASNNVAMKTSRFLDLSGFDSRFPRAGAEDRDFCDRWIEQGLKLAYEPQAVLLHSHTLTLRGFWRQHFNYGRGAWLYHRLRAQRKSGSVWQNIRMHVQLPRLLYRPVSSLSFVKRCQAAPLLVLWQVANACGFFSEMLVAALFSQSAAVTATSSAAIPATAPSRGTPRVDR